MEGEGATAALQVLVQTLITVSKEEISLIRGLEKEAGNLRKTLAMLQSFLDDAEKKFITDESVKTWLRELESLAFDADNILDELKYHALSKEVKAMELEMETEKEKAPSCFPCFNHLKRRREMALTIKGVNTKFRSINKRAKQLGLVERLAAAQSAPAVGGPETDSFAIDPIFIGRDKDVSEIVEKLTSSPMEQGISILPIVGMGGLGKTTVARKVFDHERIKTDFQERIWVHVPRNFDAKILLEKILKTLKPKDDRDGSREEVGDSRQVISQKLQKALQDKTHLIVLDDVWELDPPEWEGFKNSLSGISSTRRNGIVVTTRSQEVASIVNKPGIHMLKGLSKEDCWSIIKAKAFGGGDNIRPLFQTVGMNLAVSCQGLPLAASIVGGVLKDKSEDEWLSVQEKGLSDVDGQENISKILKLSYDNLSSPSLKKCFAYCSIFPKGYQISIQELVELWMAEDFLQPGQGNMESIGNKFCNLLLQNSLLQVAERGDDGGVTHCRMHDLVHDLASSLLNSRVNDDSDDNCRVHYIGLEHGSRYIRKEQAKCLRTLFFNAEISKTLFSHFKCLHALTLMGDDVRTLPSSIGKLIHLRYLNISDTEISHLPKSIGKLYHLQTFISDGRCCPLRKLPSTFKYLISLRHLHIHRYVEIPAEVGRLTSLQTLPYFPVGKEEGRRISELGGLKNLKGKLEISNLEEVHDKEGAEGACLFQKPNIVELVFSWSLFRAGETNDENVLEGLQPHPNLKRLYIEDYKGVRFPSWTLKMAVQHEVEDRWEGLDNLTKIKLYDCKKCEEIPMLGHLPHLKSLKLKRLRNVRSIGSSFYGIDNCNSNNNDSEEMITVFPALKKLILSFMPNLTEWVEVKSPEAVESQRREVKAFPCLEHLEIIMCKQLKSAPIHFPFLKELIISDVDLPLASIFRTELTSLARLSIRGLDYVECLPKCLFYNIKSLRELQIRDCSNLRELPAGLQTLNSLMDLDIRDCPNLKSIPWSRGEQSQGGFTSLRKLTIEYCKDELFNFPLEMAELCLPPLEELTFGGSAGAIYFWNSGRGRGFGIKTPDSWDWDSFKKIVDWMLQLGRSLTSLNVVKLKGKEEWDSLPDGLQHLTALSELSLENFGIETLPEWLGNLSSLKKFYLQGCRKLRPMPSKEAMQRLTKLEYFCIRDCPLLKERCNVDDSDSEWPEISHIPQVYLNWQLFEYGKKCMAPTIIDENGRWFRCCGP